MPKETHMIGMVLVTHGAIGAELLNALNSIVGPQMQAKAIGIGVHDDMDQCRASILAAIKDVNSGKGVVLLTDMFGGTPSNLAISTMPSNQAVVLAGVNLPMLVKLASLRPTASLLDAVREAESAGRKYIQLVSETLAPSSAA
jgi:PTS system mannose-specific IIA component